MTREVTPLRRLCRAVRPGRPGGRRVPARARSARSGAVPLLWQHRGEPVGRDRAVAEDARGLRVTGGSSDPELAALVRRGRARRAVGRLSARRGAAGRVARAAGGGAGRGEPGRAADAAAGAGRRGSFRMQLAAARSTHRSGEDRAASASTFSSEENDMDVVDTAGAGGRAGRRSGGAAFDGFVRSGATVEMKAFTGVSGDAGGYAVPREIDAAIDATLKSDLADPRDRQRREGGHRRVSQAGDDRRHAVGLGGGDRRAAGDGDADLRRDRAADGRALRQSGGEPGDARRCGVRRRGVAGGRDRDASSRGPRARRSSTATGVNRPKGFLTKPVTRRRRCDAARSGRCNIWRAGAAGDFAANPQEKLIDLVQALRAPYRQGASFVMNAATLARIRKFKTERRRVPVAAEPGGGAAGDAARLSGGRGRGHARHRGERAVDRVRQFPGRAI